MTGSGPAKSVVFAIPDGRLDRIDRPWSGVYTALAARLAGAGSAVTVAIAGDDAPTGGHWDALRKAGVSVIRIPAPAVPTQHIEVNASQARAYRVYEWLKFNAPDIVHAPSEGGLLYYCLAAKRCGAHFADTVFASHAAETALTREAARLKPLAELDPISRDYMERRSLEWADAVWSHLPARIDALIDEGVEIDRARAAILPVPLDGAETGAAKEPPSQRRIALLGPVARNGAIALARDGLSRVPDYDRPDSLVLVGPRESDFDAAAYLRRPLEGLGIGIEVVPATTWADAMPALDAAGMVMVLSDTDWAAPLVVRRLAEGRSLAILEKSDLTSLLGGAEREKIAVSANPNRLADWIARPDTSAIQRPAADAPQALEAWHAGLRAAPGPSGQRASVNGEQPTVSICLIHHERPVLLDQALDSIRAQDWVNLEVILVDDGSRSEAVQTKLASLEPEFAGRGWKIVRQPNAYLGAARNTAAREAGGDYLLFLDDDNVLKPEAVRQFVAAALASGADIVTSFCDIWQSEAPPVGGKESIRLVFEGDNLALGLLTNAFGDSNALVRRDAFLELGGNTEDYGVGKDDQEFFARAVLAGRRLVHLPEALYWYRISGTRLRHRHFSDNAGHFRVLSPYLAALPPRFRPLVALAQGLALANRGNGRLGGGDGAGELGSDDIRDLSQDLAFDPDSYRAARRFYRWQIASFSRLMRLEARLARRASRLLRRRTTR